MAPSTVKYALFVLLLAAISGGEFIINQESAVTGRSISEMADSGVTGNFVREAGQSPSGTIMLGIVAVFIIVGAVFIWKKEKLGKLLIPDTGLLVLRLALGIFLIHTGLGLEPTLAGYFSGILGIILGLLLILGLFIRIASYVSAFYAITMIIYGTEVWIGLLAAVVALGILILGAGKYCLHK